MKGKIMQFNFVQNGDFKNLTVFYNGQLLSADSNHPNFDRILAAVMSSEDVDYTALFDVAKAVATRFEKVSDRVSVANGRVYFDNEEVDGRLANQVVRFVEENDEGLAGLLAFWENLAANPQDHSREQLYSWLADRDFTILPNGNFIAYKGVSIDGDSYRSISRGKAIVDGKVHNGTIPNYVGAVVEMPRSEVAFDPAEGCSTGLHAGTWDYASNFAQGAVLKVEINPRDVVSVPTDSQHQKIRTCRYKVLEVVTQPVTSAVDYSYSEVDTWGDDSYDEYYLYEDEFDDYD